MPLYEYACTSCGHEIEVLQKMSDAALTRCPACAAESLVKKVSAAGFRLAGSGWYETDFKASGKRNLVGDAHGGSGTKAESGAATGGDGAAKSAAKPAAAPASSTTAKADA